MQQVVTSYELPEQQSRRSNGIQQKEVIVGLVANMVPYHHARWDAFARLGSYDAVVIQNTNRDKFDVLELRTPFSERFRQHTLFSETDPDAVRAAGLRRALSAALDELQPIVLCVSGYSFLQSRVALEWAIRNRKPVVLLTESNRFDAERSLWQEWIKSRLVALCSAALAGGSPHADYLRELGLPKSQIFLGYDAVDNDYFARGAALARVNQVDLRRKLGLPQNYFLACSRFGSKKNLPALIAAYGRYRRWLNSDGAGRTPWDLVIVGDGELRPEIEAEITSQQLGGVVQLMGAMSYDELPAYYGLASAFVHASTVEQWGLVVNEAMASGLPVLVSNRCGCASDLVHDSRNGFTFEPSSVNEIAERLRLLSSMDLSERQHLGEGSRKIIADWGPERFAQGLKSAVEKAMQVGPTNAAILQRALLCALLFAKR